MSAQSRQRKLDKIISTANAKTQRLSDQATAVLEYLGVEFRPCFQVFWCPSAKKWTQRDLGNAHKSRSGRSRTVKTS